jgi:hypothetical protein
MSEEAAKGGLFIPYPLLGIIFTLTLALTAGIVGLYSQLSAMNTTMILRDATYQREQAEAKRQIELLQVYVQNDREKLTRIEEQLKRRAN